MTLINAQSGDEGEEYNEREMLTDTLVGNATLGVTALGPKR